MRKSVIGRAVEGIKTARDLRAFAKAEDPVVRANAATHLARRLGRLRGLPQKLGQSLSFSESDGEPFKPLTEQGEPLALEEVEAILARAWGVPWTKHLTELAAHGLAASLGQVHNGRLRDGTAVAVKVAYPGIREAVMADLKMLGWLGRGGERFMGGFEYDAYQQVILADLEEELDYVIEAGQQAEYASLAADEPVVVPGVIPHLNRNNVLVTAWEPGQTIEMAALWPEATRHRLGHLLVNHFLTMFFVHGRLHADPHRGNYRFRSGPKGEQVVLYDYGSVARFDLRTRMLILKLIFCTANGRGEPLDLLNALGFKQDLLLPISDRLAALCRVIFEPFLDHGRFDQRQWHRKERLADILGDERWNFRLSGPAGFVFLIRGFQGVFYYLRELKVSVCWQKLLEPILKRFFPEMMALSVAPVSTGQARFEAMARHLCVRVSVGDVTRVSLKFPAGAVERLGTLMGDELLARIHRQGLKEEEVIRKARRSGYAPGELFTLREKNKKKIVTVWLE